MKERQSVPGRPIHPAESGSSIGVAGPNPSHGSEPSQQALDIKAEDLEFERQMNVGREVLRKHHNVLSALAR